MNSKITPFCLFWCSAHVTWIPCMYLFFLSRSGLKREHKIQIITYSPMVISIEKIPLSLCYLNECVTERHLMMNVKEDYYIITKTREHHSLITNQQTNICWHLWFDILLVQIMIWQCHWAQQTPIYWTAECEERKWNSKYYLLTVDSKMS